MPESIHQLSLADLLQLFMSMTTLAICTKVPLHCNCNFFITILTLNWDLSSSRMLVRLEVEWLHLSYPKYDCILQSSTSLIFIHQIYKKTTLTTPTLTLIQPKLQRIQPITNILTSIYQISKLPLNNSPIYIKGDQKMKARLSSDFPLS